MFDPVICVSMRLQDTPVISSDAFLQPRALLNPAALIVDSIWYKLNLIA
jgi:hypothetical protein